MVGAGKLEGRGLIRRTVRKFTTVTVWTVVIEDPKLWEKIVKTVPGVEYKNDTLPLNKEKKNKSDIIGFLQFSEELKTNQGIDEVEEVITKLETWLRFNFPRGTRDQQVYKRILKSGKPIELFIDWVKADEKRLSYAFLYAKDTETIWRDWPQIENNSKE